MSLARLALQMPAEGTTSGAIEDYANGRWRWTQTIKQLDTPGIYRIQVRVRHDTAADDEHAHRAPGLEARGTGIEVDEGAREHHLGEQRMGTDELAQGLEHGDEVGARVVGLGHPVEAAPQHAEALEEDLADEAGLVAEELVDGRRRGVGVARHAPGGEAGDAVAGQRGDGDAQDAVAQLGCSLLGSRHRRGS